MPHCMVCCRWRSQLVAVEVDGPQHACANDPSRLLGPTQSRYSMLLSLGYSVVRVDVEDWHRQGEECAVEGQEARDAAMAEYLEQLMIRQLGVKL